MSTDMTLYPNEMFFNKPLCTKMSESLYFMKTNIYRILLTFSIFFTLRSSSVLFFFFLLVVDDKFFTDSAYKLWNKIMSSFKIRKNAEHFKTNSGLSHCAVCVKDIWPMCSASGPIGQFLHRTRMSHVSMSCLKMLVMYVSKK
jgi:hypothetical protein